MGLTVLVEHRPRRVLAGPTGTVHEIGSGFTDLLGLDFVGAHFRERFKAAFHQPAARYALMLGDIQVDTGDMETPFVSDLWIQSNEGAIVGNEVVKDLEINGKVVVEMFPQAPLETATPKQVRSFFGRTQRGRDWAGSGEPEADQSSLG